MTTCPKCQGCGRLYSDGPVVYRFVCDRCRGTGESGEWTAAPPDKTGWYWWRDAGGTEAFVVNVSAKADMLFVYAVSGEFGLLKFWYGEWWSEPIQEPPA